jgi:hypothetical protein
VLEYDGASGAIQRWYAYGLGSNDVLNQMNVAAATRATLVPDIQGSVIASLAKRSAPTGSLNWRNTLRYSSLHAVTKTDTIVTPINYSPSQQFTPAALVPLAHQQKGRLHKFPGIVPDDS